ncbi:auxin-responsive protein SAUR21 [Trifolium repens]|nr:auxin-responsive protein SAUR21 [Trifolium repens]
MGIRLPFMVLHANKIFKSSSQHLHSRNHSNVPKGHVAVYVGESQKKRFVVPISYLNHPSFLDLLNRGLSVWDKVAYWFYHLKLNSVRGRCILLVVCFCEGRLFICIIALVHDDDNFEIGGVSYLIQRVYCILMEVSSKHYSSILVMIWLVGYLL